MELRETPRVLTKFYPLQDNRTEPAGVVLFATHSLQRAARATRMRPGVRELARFYAAESIRPSYRTSVSRDTGVIHAPDSFDLR
jgi:hypothetical protein